MINEKLNKDILDLINENKTEIETKINNLKGKILWTNSNPENNFSAQNISLSDSDWDCYEVIYGSDAVANAKMMSVKSIKNRGCKLNSKVGSNNICDREIQYKNQTLFYVNGAYVNNALNNQYLIPIYIIGYKTGLFS